jgi:hypothetical protein
MIYSQERKENNNQSHNACDHVHKNSTRSNGCSLCPIELFLLVLLHVVPTFAGHQLLIFSPFRRPGATLTPSFYTDPISLRSQATGRFQVGHRYELSSAFQFFYFFQNGCPYAAPFFSTFYIMNN